MLSGSYDKTLRIWNISTYQCESIIEGVECYWMNAIYQIDNERVIVGGRNKFTIVDIKNYMIETIIVENTIKYFSCFLKLRDNKTIISGCTGGMFCFYYDMNTEKCITRKYII